ncbi:MAG: hypothetical protein EOL97_13520 [Spirochaetia bacterium]|nr:hypothetical protein [Spirochaetia bacterium]
MNKVLLHLIEAIQELKLQGQTPKYIVHNHNDLKDIKEFKSLKVIMEDIEVEKVYIMTEEDEEFYKKLMNWRSS